MSSEVLEIWNKCLVYIKNRIDENSYKNWFLPIVPLKFENKKITIQVPSTFFCEWLDKNYAPLLKTSFEKFLGDNVHLVYQIKGNVPFEAENKKKVLDEKKTAAKKQVKKIKHPSQLNDKFSFDTFVKGDANALALNAALSIAENPGKTPFNPFFIYSKVGLGKTHLVNALGLQIEKKYPEKQVLYVTADVFVQQFMESTRSKKRNDFIHFYQNIDTLIVDDVQFFSGKEGTQGVFFEIFNYLYHNNKQLVLTSDKSPAETKDIQDRLISRFKWGMNVQLEIPKLETRIKILNKKIELEDVAIPENIIHYLAEKIKTDMRELQGAFIGLMGKASLLRKAYSLDLAREVVKQYLTVEKKRITTEYIVEIVARHYGIDLELLHSKKRQANIVKSRQVAMYFARKHTRDSLKMIGHKIGKRNHATVLSSEKSVNNLLDTDKNFKIEIDEIQNKILN